MAIVRLAFSNVWRRLSRSVLTLFAMAVAAMVLTSGMSLSQGVTRLAFKEYSNYYQGDILVFSPGFVGAAPTNKEDSEVVRRTLGDSGFNPLLRIYPNFRTEGYYANKDLVYEAISAEMLVALSNQPGVVEVRPYLVMPVAAKGVKVILRPAPVGYIEHLSEGGPLSDGTMLEVVLNAYGSVPDVKIDDLITIAVPAYGVDQNGIPYVDSTLPTTPYEARVVGMVSWPTRSVGWLGPADIPMSEQAYVHAPDCFITDESWQRIWATHSQGQAYGPTAASISISDMGQLFMYTKGLRDAVPELSVLPISQVVQHVLRYGLIDRFYDAPRMLWAGEPNQEQPFATQDFAKLTGILLFVNAGMLMASQMLAAVAARRKEIGILKAIGARQREVVSLILIEAMFLALIGSSVGFLLIRLAAVHQALTNGVAWTIVLANAAIEMGLVLGLTGGLALLFGVMPAWRVARLTVMEVFRNE